MEAIQCVPILIKGHWFDRLLDYSVKVKFGKGLFGQFGNVFFSKKLYRAVVLFAVRAEWWGNCRMDVEIAVWSYRMEYSCILLVKSWNGFYVY
jgi:hypothetical protein